MVIPFPFRASRRTALRPTMDRTKSPSMCIIGLFYSRRSIVKSRFQSETLWHESQGELVDKPIIAVPTSVGYGANFGGLSALLSMLNSCIFLPRSFQRGAR